MRKTHRMAAVAFVGLLGAVSAASCSSSDPGVPLSEAGQRGQEVARARGCTSCHTVDGSPGLGPTWAKAWGTTVPLEDGSTVTFDAAYLKESIEQPGVKLHKGFRNVMPSSSLTPQELADLQAYLQDLNPGAGGAAEPAGSAGT